MMAQNRQPHYANAKITKITNGELLLLGYLGTFWYL